MKGCRTPMTEEALPSGLGPAAWSTRYMCGFSVSWAPMVAERLFGWSSNPGESSYSQHGQPASGPSQKQSGVHPWHQSRQEAAGSSGPMSDVDSTEVVFEIRQWSLPGAAVVPVLNVSSRAGLSWMTKLFWTAILCYRKASFAMFSRRSVQLHGRALQVKGLRSPLCCRAVKMQMTGLISCCRKRTYGPPLQPGGLSQRRFPKKPFVKSGAGCRPSIYGWRSSWAGTCWLTGCTQRPQLGSHVNNFMHCFSTRLPGAAKRIPMKKKHTVDLHLKQSRHGGSNAKSGCYTSKVKVRHWSRTCRDFYSFFCLDAAWLNEGRCPGGRPSVSEN